MFYKWPIRGCQKSGFSSPFTLRSEQKEREIVVRSKAVLGSRDMMVYKMDKRKHIHKPERCTQKSFFRVEYKNSFIFFIFFF